MGELITGIPLLVFTVAYVGFLACIVLSAFRRRYS